ncbi:MAG: C4-dicarboxylate transporter/malic acid transport protein [Firmicutes bacterium]|nr:C4-dicarboxylate transporter/malic acid transport protein [Bacillota bacterium]
MTESAQCIKNFPVTLFTSAMGTGGLAIAYQRYAEISALPAILGIVLLLLAYGCFITVASVYAYKLMKYREAVLSEFNHPVQANFFPAISIGLLLLAVGTNGFDTTIATGLWTIGAGTQLLFTIRIVSRWLFQSYEIPHANPAWFIPVVGNIIVPILGVDLGHKEISWFFFSIGLSFWMLVFPIIMYRLIFHQQVAEKLMPTLFIMIAPPAVAFISYMKLDGHFDTFSRALLYLGVFLFILLFSMLSHFWRIRFFVSWWAYTFPLCALTIALIFAFKSTGYYIFFEMATVLLLLSFIAVATVLLRTMNAVRCKTLCLPEKQAG